MKRAMLLVVVVGGIVQMAVGADTHDYSNYAKLKASQTVTDGWPAAEKWNPAGGMTGEGYYLIPSEISLTTKTGNSGVGVGGIWPMAELAIQGTFAATASGSRDQVAVTPRLALCAGGTIALKSAYGTIKGGDSGTIDIRGTKDNPSRFTYEYTSPNDKPRYYAQVLSTLTASDPEAVVKFVRTATDGWDVQRAYRVEGFGDYLGSVIVEGEHTWLRPETTATEFAIGGTLELKDGGNFYVDTVSPTVGALKIGSGSSVVLVGGHSITISNALEIADDAYIAVSNVATTAFVYDDGENEPPQFPVFSFCGAEAAAAVDRDALFAAILRSGLTFRKTLASGMPRLKLTESPRADGGVDFFVSHEPIVSQLKNCLAAKGPYGYDMYEEYLSDGQAISPLKDYYSDNNIYFDSPYVFPGRSLTISGLIGFYSGEVFKTDDLFVLSGAWFRQMSTNPSGYLRGKAQLLGKLECRVHGSSAMFLESSLSGPGDLLVAFDAAKAAEKEETAARGCVELSGTNTAWTGRTLVGCGRAATGDVGLTNLTLRVSDSQNLGGGLEAFVFDSLKVADTCTFSVTDSTVFAAANRGWCLMDGSTVSVSADKTVAVNETVTFGGTVTKTGAGTLVLGGPSKAYDAENDSPVDTPNGAELVVAAGGLGASATDAFVGLSSLTFAAGTKYVASAANASGADLSAVALTVPADGVPVEFTDIPENGACIAVATFAAAEEAAKFVFVKPRGYTVTRSVVEVDGKFVLRVDIEKGGLLLLVR